MKLKTSLFPLTALLLSVSGVVQADQLQDVKSKGTMMCGVVAALKPFAYQDTASHEVVGYDVDFCKAVGFVFQQFNVFPHLSTLENICLAPMKVSGLSRGASKERALDLLDKVGLRSKANAYPQQLSGGQQQQRVAIARARHAAAGNAFRRAHQRPGPGNGRRGDRCDEDAGARRHDDDLRNP